MIERIDAERGWQGLWLCSGCGKPDSPALKSTALQRWSDLPCAALVEGRACRVRGMGTAGGSEPEGADAAASAREGGEPITVAGGLKPRVLRWR